MAMTDDGAFQEYIIKFMMRLGALGNILQTLRCAARLVSSRELTDCYGQMRRLVYTAGLDYGIFLFDVAVVHNLCAAMVWVLQ